MIQKDDERDWFDRLLKGWYYAIFLFGAYGLFEGITTVIADKVASRITGKYYNYWCTTYSLFCGWLG